MGAHDAGLLEIRIHNLRDWTHDRHKTVDDRPFGGAEGMVLKCQPIFDAVEAIWPERNEGQRVALLSAQGRMFDQALANRLKESSELLLICGGIGYFFYILGGWLGERFGRRAVLIGTGILVAPLSLAFLYVDRKSVV